MRICPRCRPIHPRIRNPAVVPLAVVPAAGVAQLVEQLIRNQQVRGSSPRAGSKSPRKTNDLEYGWMTGLQLTPYLTPRSVVTPICGVTWSVLGCSYLIRVSRLWNIIRIRTRCCGIGLTVPVS